MNVFTLDNSEEIIDALHDYYYLQGDADTYLDCLLYLNHYIQDDNIRFEIKDVCEFMEYETPNFESIRDMSEKIIRSIVDYCFIDNNFDSDMFSSIINELNYYVDTNTFTSSIESVLDDIHICYKDYIQMNYKLTGYEDENPYENGSYVCPYCGYEIE